MLGMTNFVVEYSPLFSFPGDRSLGNSGEEDSEKQLQTLDPAHWQAEISEEKIFLWETSPSVRNSGCHWTPSTKE